MTFVAPDPVSSGRPYKVSGTTVGVLNDLKQFIGDAGFTIDKDGAESVVRGSGVADETGVRFHEKDVEHGGRDVRTWHITEPSAGQFLATPVGTF